jgi:hypothetical protein
MLICHTDEESSESESEGGTPKASRRAAIQQKFHSGSSKFHLIVLALIVVVLGGVGAIIGICCFGDKGGMNL